MKQFVKQIPSVTALGWGLAVGLMLSSASSHTYGQPLLGLPSLQNAESHIRNHAYADALAAIGAPGSASASLQAAHFQTKALVHLKQGDFNAAFQSLQQADWQLVRLPDSSLPVVVQNLLLWVKLSEEWGQRDAAGRYATLLAKQLPQAGSQPNLHAYAWVYAARAHLGLNDVSEASRMLRLVRRFPEDNPDLELAKEALLLELQLNAHPYVNRRCRNDTLILHMTNQRGVGPVEAGWGHANPLEARLMLAESEHYANTGMPGLALEMLHQLRQRIPRAQPQLRQQLWQQLAGLMLLAGAPDTAAAFADSALWLATAVFGGGHPAVFRALEAGAHALWLKGNWPEAIRRMHSVVVRLGPGSGFPAHEAIGMLQGWAFRLKRTELPAAAALATLCAALAEAAVANDEALRASPLAQLWATRKLWLAGSECGRLCGDPPPSGGEAPPSPDDVLQAAFYAQSAPQQQARMALGRLHQAWASLTPQAQAWLVAREPETVWALALLAEKALALRQVEWALAFGEAGFGAIGFLRETRPTAALSLIAAGCLQRLAWPIAEAMHTRCALGGQAHGHEQLAKFIMRVYQTEFWAAAYWALDAQWGAHPELAEARAHRLRWAQLLAGTTGIAWEDFRAEWATRARAAQGSRALRQTQPLASLLMAVEPALPTAPPTDTTALVLLLLPTDSALFAVGLHKSHSFVRRTAHDGRLQSRIRLLGAGIAQRETLQVRGAGVKLFETIFGPILANFPLGAQHVHIVPSGLLADLPFHALLYRIPVLNSPDTTWKWLSQRFRITYQMPFAATAPATPASDSLWNRPLGQLRVWGRASLLAPSTDTVYSRAGRQQPGAHWLVGGPRFVYEASPSPPGTAIWASLAHAVLAKPQTVAVWLGHLPRPRGLPPLPTSAQSLNAWQWQQQLAPATAPPYFWSGLWLWAPAE